MATKSSQAANSTVRVLYDYEYKAGDGNLVNLKKGSEYVLVKKANEEWWAVCEQGSKKYIFVPANYVEIIQKADKDKKAKKKPPPPKPPKPKLPQPGLDPGVVIKELDEMLDMVVMVESDDDKDSNDNLSLKDELRAKTPEKELDSPNQTEPTENHMDRLCAPSGEASTTASLDRNKVSRAGPGHTRSASASAVPSQGELQADNKRPKAQPRLTNINYNEQPMYANLQELEDKASAPATAKVHAVTETDDGDEPSYANLSSIQAAMYPKHAPPSCPPPGCVPLRTIDVQWCMYEDNKSGHNYYYNATTGESTWRPPQRGPEEATAEEEQPPPGLCHISSGSVPSGWKEERTETGEIVYKNEFTGEKWLQSASNESGQVYYYKEGTSESSWELPEINLKPTLDKNFQGLHHPLNLPKSRASWSPGEYTQLKRVAIPHLHKMVQSVRKASSAVCSPPVREEDEEMRLTHGDVFEAATDSDPLPTVRLSQIPQHSRIREMQTMLNRSKVMENGKKLKKNWAQSYIVTTGPFMYFYKDQKSAQPKPNMPVGKYDVQLDLRGASVEQAPKDLSSKKNVILLSLSGGATQYLLQSDDKARLQDWYTTLITNISLLGSSEPEELGQSNHHDRPPESPTLSKAGKGRRATRREKGSTLERPTTPDDLLSGAEKNIKIKDWLLYWLLRRPTAESLKEKGIIKDSIFGSHLQSICDREKVQVPRFVHHCIHAVDKRGLSVGGIYRISGNMAAIQKLRFLVDHGEKFDLLSPDWDIHDISGALKLFFRELQEPLYPFVLYDKFTKASQILNRQLKLKAFQDIIKELPKINYITIRDLFAHLRRVVEHSKENKMEAQNVAIVFGPTLMRPLEEMGNMAANLVMQGQIVEYMILEYRSLF